LALPLALFALLLAVSANSTNFYFPPLARVLDRFDALWLGPRFASDVLPSLVRLIAGYHRLLAGRDRRAARHVPPGRAADRCWNSFVRHRRQR
jgi:hypothetical protein